MKNCIVTILLNGEVWGSWTIDQKPSLQERLELRRVVAQADSGSNKFQVQYSDNLESDTFSDLMSGIKESLYNDFHLENKD